MASVRLTLLVCVAVYTAVTPNSWIFADERSTAAGAASSRMESAAERLDYTPPAWPEPPNTGALLLRLAGGTATVLVLCVLTLVASRRWLRGPVAKAGEGSELQVLESVSLGNRCCVHLVRAGRHQIVVGVDGSGLKSLVPLPESFDKSLAEAEAQELPTNAAAAAEQPVWVGA